MWRLRACLLLFVLASASAVDEENETSEATTWTAPHLDGSSEADLLKWALGAPLPLTSAPTERYADCHAAISGSGSPPAPPSPSQRTVSRTSSVARPSC